ncbi:MAG TPA: FAD-dependent monooxygenase, partial [Chryseolinea sp.]|nr:FAD-dependent monooxygenase [Chryseolinea sp.]
WETELVDFSQGDDNVKVVVKNSGIEETIQADWLVGADGARSQVRQILDIPFAGQTYPIDLFVLDCRVNWNLKEDEMYIAFSDHSFAGFFPMPEGRCRVIGFVPKEAALKEEITFEDVNNGFADRMQMKIKLYDPSWISMYHSHHRYVSQFKIGRCFLAGDSAHIHSPVGAQGMNTGLQDAFNLAWKLAVVIKKWAKKDLLNTYQEERLPFARRLVRSTDRAFNMTASQKGLMKYMRMHIAPRILAILLKIKPVERFLFRNISQIGISYRDGLLSANGKDTGFGSSAPKPGERLPYLEFEDRLGQRVNIQKRVDATSLHLFIFSSFSKDADEELIKFLEQYKGVITYESILFTPATRELYKNLDIMEGGLYLIRPDLYIAYRSQSFDLDGLKNYLQLFLILNYNRKGM